MFFDLCKSTSKKVLIGPIWLYGSRQKKRSQQIKWSHDSSDLGSDKDNRESDDENKSHFEQDDDENIV